MRAARYPTVGATAGDLSVHVIYRPTPDVGEVLVQVTVSGVNPTDWKARNRLKEGERRDIKRGSALPGSGSVSASGLTVGDGQAPSDTDWVVPHHDGAGVIVDVGPGVSRNRVGERVWLWQAAWRRRGGTACEFVALPGNHAVPLPYGVTDVLAAGLGIPAMTAHYCLFIDGPLDSTDRVLVHGGAGAVGHAAIELARHAGAQVATTVSTPEKVTIAEASRADLVLNYREDDVIAKLREWAPAGVTRIVDVDLAANIDVDASVAAPGAAVLVYAQPSGPVTAPWRLLEANLRVEFMLVYTISESAKRAAVAGVTSALAAGAMSSLPTVRFPLGEVDRAHEAVKNGTAGKVLIDVANTFASDDEVFSVTDAGSPSNGRLDRNHVGQRSEEGLD